MKSSTFDLNLSQRDVSDAWIVAGLAIPCAVVWREVIVLREVIMYFRP